MTSPSTHPFKYGQPASSSLGMGATSLQQASRNLGGQQFQGRVGGNTNHIPGHITPTSSGIPNFSTCLPNNLPPQQASPNNIQTPDDFTKRDRSVMFTVGGSNVSGISNYSLSHNSRGFTTQNMLNSGIQNNSFSASPALDLSEFPSLTNRSAQENSNSNIAHNPMAGRPPYVGMVKQPTNESSEFHIHSEDFPALPGSQSQESSQENINKTVTGKVLNSSKKSNYFLDISSSQIQKHDFQNSKNGRVTNIPSGMVTDQFGMVGLLTFIRAAETDPKLVSLALGSDLTTLGLNLNTSENLYPSFGGPWAEQPCRPQDIDYYVPSEYLVNQNIRDKLAPVKLNRYGEDLLFFLFYMFSGDVMQVAAAVELYNRDWRFHKDERVWITRVPGMVPTEKTGSYERGMYYFFDPENWRKVPKEFHLDYERLEERAMAPPSVSVLGSTQPMIA